MGEYSRNIKIPDAEVEKYFEQHKDEFTTVNLTGIQVPVASESELAAAKAKADTLWKQLQAGTKFDALAKQYPLPGFHSYKQSDPKIPAEVKTAMSALKPGGYTRPIALPSGVFILRLDGVEAKPFRDARGDVLKTMQDAQFNAWMDGIRSSVVVGKK